MHVYIITAAFIALDMVTGLVKAFKRKEFTSSVMREGLFHKIGSVICVAFATLIDYAQGYLDLGVTVPLTVGVCTYIVLMEIGSIIENVTIINPNILPKKIKSFFGKLSEPDEQEE